VTLLFRQCLAESIGTFALVFFGTGAMVVDDVTGGAIGTAGVGIAFGLVVMAMIYALGELSGAHLNPAVSVGFLLAQRIDAKKAGLYIAFQLLGAIAASAVLRVIYPAHDTLGATLPHAGVGAAFVLETLLTFTLVMVILRVAIGSKEQGLMAGIAVGGAVAICAIAFGPACGASMNPARSIGPALLSGTFAHQWLYLLAPMVGSGLAVAAWLALAGPTTDAPSVVPAADALESRDAT